MTFLTFWKTLPLGEGFGFNGNILETNILNLAVVLAVVVSLGGDALKSLLENRKQEIVQNLEEVEKRAKEAEASLKDAVAQLELAQKKAVEIKEQGVKTAEQEKRQSIRQTEEDAHQLELMQEEALRLQQQKAISQISKQVVNLALKRVYTKLTSRLDDRFHRSVNNFHIALFAGYNKK